MLELSIQRLKEKLSTNRVLTKNILGVLFLKGFSLIISFVMTPMYIRYFENQNILGVWYTLQSILLWILTFDLGLGNGIRNRLAHDIAVEDKIDARKTVSSGYIVLGIVTGIVIIGLLILMPFLNWKKILNTDITSRVLNSVLFITIMGIVLQFFFKVVSSILMALRKNILANSLPILTNIIILVFLIFSGNKNDEIKFIRLAIMYSLATILPLVGATVYVFSGKLKTIRPSFKFWDKKIALSVLKVGGSFFAVQLGLLVVNSTNQFLINYLYAGEAVVKYTLYYNLFSLAPMIFTLFTQPVWSEISIKYAQGNLGWIKEIRKFMFFVAAVISLGCLMVTGLLPWIFRIWLGSENSINPSRLLGLLFSLWAIIEVFIYASTCIANGMTQLKCQTVFTLLAAVAKIPVAFILSTVFQHWISVLLAHVVVLLPLLVAQNLDLSKKLKSIREE